MKMLSHLMCLSLILFWNAAKSDKQDFYSYPKTASSNAEEAKSSPTVPQTPPTEIIASYRNQKTAFPSLTKYPLKQQNFNSHNNDDWQIPYTHDSPNNYNPNNYDTKNTYGHDRQGIYSHSPQNNFSQVYPYPNTYNNPQTADSNPKLGQYPSRFDDRSNVSDLLEKILNQLVHIGQLLTIQVLDNSRSEPTKAPPPPLHPLLNIQSGQSSSYRLPVENIQVKLNRNKHPQHQLAYHQGEPLQLGIKYKKHNSANFPEILKKIRLDDLRLLMLGIQDEFKNRGVIPSSETLMQDSSGSQPSTGSPSGAAGNLHDILWKLLMTQNNPHLENTLETQTSINNLQNQIIQRLLEDFKLEQESAYSSEAKIPVVESPLSLNDLLMKIQEGKLNLRIFR